MLKSQGTSPLFSSKSSKYISPSKNGWNSSLLMVKFAAGELTGTVLFSPLKWISYDSTHMRLALVDKAIVTIASDSSTGLEDGWHTAVTDPFKQTADTSRQTNGREVRG